MFFFSHTRKLLLLSGLLITSCFANAQNVKSKQVTDLENLYFFIDRLEVKVSDTFNLNKIADSVAKEENIEKTEYARFFVFLQKKKLFKDDSIKIFFDRYLHVFANCKTPGVRSTCKFYYGNCLFEAKDYSTGIQLMLEAKSEFENIGYEKIPEISIPFYVLSLDYYNFNNYRKSIEYAALANKYRATKVTTGTNNTIGLAYQKLGLFDSAIIKFKETMQQAKNENTLIWYSISAGNLGRTYCLEKNYTQGIPLLFTDVQMGKKDEPINSALSSLYIADAYNKQLLPDSARHYISLSKEILDHDNLWGSEKFYHTRFCYYYYIQLAELNKLLNNYEEAYKNLDSANINKEKYESQFDWKLLTSAEKRIEGLEYQQNINLLASQKKNQQLQKIILFIILGAVLVIVILLQYWQKIKRRKEKQLATEKEANLLLKQQQAEQELENARQQLDELLIKFQEKSLLKENLAADLAEVSKTGEVILSKEQASKIISELTNASLLTNRDWELFQQRFEKVHNNFFSNLAREVPGITPSEERMLALLKLKVSYRHMAQMLGISPESVRTSKYRLRKKLISHNQPELLAHLEE